MAKLNSGTRIYGTATVDATLTLGGSISANGSQGTAGQVLTSAGSGSNTYWSSTAGAQGPQGNAGSLGPTGPQGPQGSNATISVTDDTTTAASRYILFANQTSGSITSSYVSSSKIYFNPSTGVLNATSFNSLSDYFSKYDIHTLEDALQKVLKLRGVGFKYKDINITSMGVIAQEIEEVIPEVVSTNEDGIKSVSYDGIVGLLIEAIKQQQITIDRLETKINKLFKQ
jgi:hypothetical protein